LGFFIYVYFFDSLKRQNTIFTTGRFKAKLKEELTADEMDLLTYARDSLHLLSVSLEFEDRALETEYRVRCFVLYFNKKGFTRVYIARFR